MKFCLSFASVLVATSGFVSGQSVSFGQTNVEVSQFAGSVGIPVVFSGYVPDDPYDRMYADIRVQNGTARNGVEYGIPSAYVEPSGWDASLEYQYNVPRTSVYTITIPMARTPYDTTFSARLTYAHSHLGWPDYGPVTVVEPSSILITIKGLPQVFFSLESQLASAKKKLTNTKKIKNPKIRRKKAKKLKRKITKLNGRYSILIRSLR